MAITYVQPTFTAENNSTSPDARLGEVGLFQTSPERTHHNGPRRWRHSESIRNFKMKISVSQCFKIIGFRGCPTFRWNATVSRRIHRCRCVLSSCRTVKRDRLPVTIVYFAENSIESLTRSIWFALSAVAVSDTNRTTNTRTRRLVRQSWTLRCTADYGRCPTQPA